MFAKVASNWKYLEKLALSWQIFVICCLFDSYVAGNCMSMCECVCTCLYWCMCVCTCVCICVCVGVCVCLCVLYVPVSECVCDKHQVSSSVAFYHIFWDIFLNIKWCTPVLMWAIQAPRILLSFFPMCWNFMHVLPC